MWSLIGAFLHHWKPSATASAPATPAIHSLFRYAALHHSDYETTRSGSL